MTDKTLRPLFRTEALKWRNEAWIGGTQLIEPLSARVTAAAVIVLVLALCVYVALGGYTRRVHTKGFLLPPAGLVTMEASQNGTIAQSAVREGLHVRVGEPLFVIDVQTYSQAGPTGTRSLKELLAEHALLVSRRDVLARDASVELASYKDQLTFLHEQRDMLNEQLRRDQASLPLVERAMNEMRQAIGTHLVTESQFQGQLSAYVQFMNTHSETLRNLAQNNGQISDLQFKIDRHDSKVWQDINDVDMHLSDIGRQVVQANGQETIVINAPVEGTVDGIRGHVGQYVASGQPLATLMPDHTTLQAELYVDSKVIGFVRPGQRVLLKYAAYPYQRFGLHGGTVVEVTKAPLPEMSGYVAQNDGSSAEDRKTNPAPPQGDTYRIRVQPDEAFVMAYGRQEHLVPGMAVEADIAIDYRKLYQWILDPVISMKSSFRTISEKNP